MTEFASELEYLKWFYQKADFGPADEDVKNDMKEMFQIETKKYLPRGYNYCNCGNELIEDGELRAGVCEECQ